MASYMPNDFGVMICEALNLDAKLVRRIKFDWTPGSIGEVDVTLLLSEHAADGVTEVVKRYRLVEVSEKENETSGAHYR